MNRDIEELRAVLAIMQDIQNLEARRAWQRDRLFSVTQHYTGMPGKKGGVPAGLDAVIGELSELDGEQAALLRSYVERLKRAEAILNGIENRAGRTFVEMRYVNGLSRQRIMAALNLTEHEFRMTRAAVERAEDMRHVIWPAAGAFE